MKRSRVTLPNRAAVLVCVVATLPAAPAQSPPAPSETVATVLADFESDSVAPVIAEVVNVLAGDCSVKRVPIPAHGQSALAVEIGATQPGAAVAVDLLFRVESRIQHPIAAAVFSWINDGDAAVAFRIRDDRGRIYETAPQPISGTRRWVRLSAPLDAANLKLRATGKTPAGKPGAASAPGEDAAPALPLEVVGLRVETSRVGRQAVFFDDLEVEQRVEPQEMVRAEYLFDQPTHLYVPGATVKGKIELENGSRTAKLDLSVELSWLRADGSKLAGASASVNLPASGREFRSRQPVEFAQRIDESGFYRLVARVRSPRWKSPAVFESTVLVTPSNRALPRGRSVFFGLRSNLLREPSAEQLAEISVAREIGVQLLALEALWARLEPKPGQYELADLDAAVSAALSRDLAPLIAVSSPPDWLAPGEEAAKRLTALLEALVKHFGARVAYYAVGDDAATAAVLTPASVSELRKRLAPIQQAVQLVAPPVRLGPARTPDAGAPFTRTDGIIATWETSGYAADALAALQALAQREKLAWTPQTWWMHRGEPLAGAGTPTDAHVVLRFYVDAARAGVGSLVWFDLRDDMTDPRRADQMIGLQRRDFSPRTTLLGYAVSVGMLSGLRHNGTLTGAPSEIDAALFLSSNRQVAVLMPRPNRIRPAVLAPISGEPGPIEVVDFERRPHKLLESEGAPLALTRGEPFFITVDFQKIRPEPQLELARPWLRLPATLLAGAGATFKVELDAPIALKQSFMQLVLPQDAPYASSLSSRRIQAKPGETVAVEGSLTPVEGRDFELSSLTLRVSLERKALDIPLEVRPLSAVPPRAAGAADDEARCRIGALTRADDKGEAAEALPIFASWNRSELTLAVGLPASPGAGDRLDLGFAAENSETHVEASIRSVASTPAVEPLSGTDAVALRGWQTSVQTGREPGRKVCVVTIPVASLGRAAASAGDRFLVAAAYRRGSGAALRWGQGLDDSRSSAGFRWLVLVDR